MSYYEDQKVRARLREDGAVFAFAARIAQGFAVAYRRHKTERELRKLDDHMLKDIGLERGPDGHFIRRPR